MECDNGRVGRRCQVRRDVNNAAATLYFGMECGHGRMAAAWTSAYMLSQRPRPLTHGAHAGSRARARVRAVARVRARVRPDLTRIPMSKVIQAGL